MSTIKSIYLAGPMRGRREFNFPQFFRAARDLAAAGLEVFNPAAQDDDRGFPWEGTDGWEDLTSLGLDLRQAMGDDVNYIASAADAVVTLPGWEDSKGSRAEVALALSLDLPVWQYDEVAHRRARRETRPGYFYNDDSAFAVGDPSPVFGEHGPIPFVPAYILDAIAKDAINTPRKHGHGPLAEGLFRASGEETELGWEPADVEPFPESDLTESLEAASDAIATLASITVPFPEYDDEENVIDGDEDDLQPYDVEVQTWSGEIVRRFSTGATRDSNNGKFEFARFFDPRVLEARAAYMHKHRLLPDGTLRDPDNWKQGIPVRAYMDGLFRHLVDVWTIYEYGTATRPESGESVDLVEALAAIMFNAEGWLHSLLTDAPAVEEAAA